VQLCTWLRMLKISWTEKVTNEEMLLHSMETRSLLKMISTRSIDGLGMFSGTFSVTFSRRQMMARLLRVGKG